jgi:hypothetical protein
MSEMIPKSFYISIWSYSEGYALRRKWGALHYYRFAIMNGKDLVETKKIVPSLQQWQTFWDKVNELEIWDWKPNYPNPGFLGSEKWEIDINAGRRRIVSRGEGNYPKQNASLSNTEFGRSRAFLDLIVAVRNLIGGLSFS